MGEQKQVDAEREEDDDNTGVPMIKYVHQHESYPMAR